MRGVEASRTALLSQEGSTIETAVEIVRGVVPEPHSLGIHSETIRLGSHPSRHRKVRDAAAAFSSLLRPNGLAFAPLMTQGVNSPALTVTDILYGKSILDAVAKRGFGFQKRPRVAFRLDPRGARPFILDRCSLRPRTLYHPQQI